MMIRVRHFMKRGIIAAALVPMFHQVHLNAAQSVTVDPSKVLREVRMDRLLGGNLALWYKPQVLASPELAASLRIWRPTLLRLPGGSWSDEIYWNGHGVRDGAAFDHSKFADGRWQVDYSAYAPGFRIMKGGALSDFHGHADVRTLHEFVKKLGAEAIVTVNAGTGTPEMAAEWVRWAKHQNYQIAWWEIGNELDGEWELGHFLPDGKPMDAAAYVARYLEFAKAMKAVDPSIKVGGPTCSSDKLPFVEELLRDGGDLVDFISFHTYPVLGGRVAERERMASTSNVAGAVAKIRGWIAKHQPQRAGEIRIGITEWHKQVMETRATADLTSGIWGCLFIGAMAEAGVDFANVWDCFSTTENGGHGLFDRSGQNPRAMFHALSLWRDMGDQVLAAGSTGELRVFATLRPGAVEVLVVNPARRADRFSLTLGDRGVTGSLPARRLSQREYFWNPIRNAPEWSEAPRMVELASGNDGMFEISPMTALRFSLSLTDIARPAVPATAAGRPVLEILLPDAAPADLPVEGFVVVRDSESGGAYQGTIAGVRLVASGAEPGESYSDTSTSVARFELTADKPGEVVVEARGPDGLTATRAVKLTAVAERAEVIWEFLDEAALKAMETDYSLSLDAAARPNQTVAAVSLSKSSGEARKNTLLVIKDLPANLRKDRIGGVCGKIGASVDFTSEDPAAAVQIVIQSKLDYWIPVGEIPIAGLKGNWKDVTLRFNNAATIAAAGEIYSIRFQLTTLKPVTGRIYLDDLGFLFRGN